MNEGFMELADKISKMTEEAYPTYESLVDNICQRNATQDEVEHMLDKLLDLAYGDKYLMLYKKVCRRYAHKYPESIKFYIDSYREMWDLDEQQN